MALCGTRPLAAFGVLTMNPRSESNQRLHSARLSLSQSMPACPQLLFLYVVFIGDEPPGEDWHWDGRADVEVETALLKKPPQLTKNNVCAVKILCWLRYARNTPDLRRAAFVGWIDDDTIVDPTLVQRHLFGWRHLRWAYGGAFHHCQNYWPRNFSTYEYLGEPSVHTEERLRMRAQRGTLYSSSFAYAHGAFTYYSAAAVDRVLGLAWPLLERGKLDNVEAGTHYRSTCNMPTDITLGWLTKLALSGEHLVCVHLRATQYQNLPRAPDKRILGQTLNGSWRTPLYMHSNILRTAVADQVTARLLLAKKWAVALNFRGDHCDKRALDAWSHASVANWSVVWTNDRPNQSCSTVLPA